MYIPHAVPPPPPVFSHGHLHSFSHLVLGTHIHLIIFSHISYCWLFEINKCYTHSLRDTYHAISHTPHAFTFTTPPPPHLLWTLALFHPFCVKVRTIRQFLTYLILFSTISAKDACTVSPILCYEHTQTISDTSHTVSPHLCQGHLHCFTPAKDNCIVSPLPRTFALFHPCQGHLHCFTPLMSHFNLFFPFCARETLINLFFPFCARETLISNCSSSFMSEVILH